MESKSKKVMEISLEITKYPFEFVKETANIFAKILVHSDMAFGLYQNSGLTLDAWWSIYTSAEIRAKPPAMVQLEIMTMKDNGEDLTDLFMAKKFLSLIKWRSNQALLENINLN